MGAGGGNKRNRKRKRNTVIVKELRDALTMFKSDIEVLFEVSYECAPEVPDTFCYRGIKGVKITEFLAPSEFEKYDIDQEMLARKEDIDDILWKIECHYRDDENTRQKPDETDEDFNMRVRKMLDEVEPKLKWEKALVVVLDVE